jgi:hypothetical protein
MSTDEKFVGLLMKAVGSHTKWLISRSVLLRSGNGGLRWNQRKNAVPMVYRSVQKKKAKNTEIIAQIRNNPIA